MEENTKKTQKQTENVIEKENKIVTGVIWQQLLLFFFPILFGTFFQQLYNAADAVIVGRFVGKEALSAVGGGTGTLIQLLVIFRGIVQRCHSHYLSVLWGKTCRDGRLCRTYLHCVQPGSGSRHDDRGYYGGTMGTARDVYT